MLSYFRLYPILFVLLLSLFLPACGGSSSSGNPNFTLSTSEVFFGAPVGGSKPDDFTISSNVENYSGPLHIEIEHTSKGISSITLPVAQGTSGSSTIVPKDPAMLAQGVYFDTIKVSACTDSTCNEHLPGSPEEIPVTYVVGIATEPGVLYFSAKAGQAPTPQTLTVYHYMQGNNWASSLLHLNGSGWMSYNPPGGQTPAIVTVELTAMPANTAPGSLFRAEINIGANAGMDLYTIPINYTVN